MFERTALNPSRGPWSVPAPNSFNVSLPFVACWSQAIPFRQIGGTREAGGFGWENLSWMGSPVYVILGSAAGSLWLNQSSTTSAKAGATESVPMASPTPSNKLRSGLTFVRMVLTCLPPMNSSQRGVSLQIS
jgi:hypothetical protein